MSTVVEAPMQHWPNGKRIAVATTVMFETWSEGKAPNYSVQATHLKPGTVDHAGAAWATYGGRVGVWRIVRTLDRLKVPATFFTNARCAEIYPDAVAICRFGARHCRPRLYPGRPAGVLGPEEERATIRKMHRSARRQDRPGAVRLAEFGAPPFTPHTAGFLAEAGLRWQADVTYADLPSMMQTAHGPIAAVPFSDFTDNRVLRSNPRDLFDVYRDTFDYLYRNEPAAMLVLTLHCHFGGRPLVTAVFEQIINYIRQFQDVWFARHAELGDWARAHSDLDTSYRKRFFAV